jgi:hypothetical protein
MALIMHVRLFACFTAVGGRLLSLVVELTWILCFLFFFIVRQNADFVFSSRPCYCLFFFFFFFFFSSFIFIFVFFVLDPFSVLYPFIFTYHVWSCLVGCTRDFSLLERKNIHNSNNISCCYFGAILVCLLRVIFFSGPSLS